MWFVKCHTSLQFSGVDFKTNNVTKIMKKLILLALVVVATSCVTERRCNRRYPPVTSDSVYINTTSYIRDTIVNYSIQSDTVRVVTPDDYSILTNKYCTTTARTANGLLYHELITTAQELPVTVQTKYITRTEYKDRTQVVTQRYVPRFTRVLAWIGGILLLLVTGYFTLKILK